jgi:hypothetical protein
MVGDKHICIAAHSVRSTTRFRPPELRQLQVIFRGSRGFGALPSKHCLNR